MEAPLFSSTQKPLRAEAITQPNQRYCNNEQAIRAAICKNISERRLDVRISEICEAAGISLPTFYAHHLNLSSAKAKYEDTLNEDFCCSVHRDTRRDVFFGLLTLYVLKHQEYFLAVHQGADHYLLSKMISQHRTNLVSSEVSDRTFCAYTGSLQIVIGCWLNFDVLSKVSAKKCANELLKVRVVQMT